MTKAKSEGGGDGEEEQEEDEDDEGEKESNGKKEAEATAKQAQTEPKTIKTLPVKNGGKSGTAGTKRRRKKDEDMPQHRCEGCKSMFLSSRYVVQHLTRDKCPATKRSAYQCTRFTLQSTE